MMTEQDSLTSQQASAALESINKSKNTVVKSQKPPIFLALLICLSYASIVFGYGMAEHENNWALAMWIGAIAFFVSTSFYYYTFRLLGIRVNIIPRSKNSLKLNFVIGIILAVMVFSAREVRLFGFEQAPHLFALACGIVLFISLRKFPSGEVLPKDAEETTTENSHE